MRNAIEQAKARVGRAPLSGFPLGDTTIAVLGVAGSVAANLTVGTASNALYDWAEAPGERGIERRRYFRRKSRSPISSLPNGTRIIVIQRAES